MSNEHDDDRDEKREKNEKRENDVPLAPGALEAWTAQTPSADFAERVLTRVRKEQEKEQQEETSAAPPLRNRRRWGFVLASAATLSIAAAIVLGVGGGAGAHGEAIARDREEIAIGTRAKAVLEPGAHVAWDGDLVTQTSGDVFYRVEPGARFRVHTPAGDVEVKGTCFAVNVRGGSETPDGRNGTELSNSAGTNMQKRDMKAGAMGAALSALAFVAVYEGKVSVSHASEHVDLAAGESAEIGPDGAKRTGSADEGRKAFDENVSARGGDPLSAANENLVAQVEEYKHRLDALAAQKSDVEKKLDLTEKKLASATDGGAARAKNEYDLDPQDWADLAKRGKIKYRMPCVRSDQWVPSQDKLANMGLAPQDGATLQDAYQRSYSRIWSVVKPLCQQALGTSDAIVEKIGPEQCVHLIYDLASRADRAGTSEAHIEVAEIRAGIRPEPPPDKQPPAMTMLLALTGAEGAFEADLAKSLGPDEAHRVAWSDGVCMSNNSWGTTPRGEK